MIAYLMIYGGLPVIHGVIGMMAVGFLTPIFIGEYIASAFAWLNSAMHQMSYSFPSSPDFLHSFYLWFNLPTEVEVELILGFMFTYMAIEILIFAVVLTRLAKKGRRIPKIKQGEIPVPDSDVSGYHSKNRGPF